MSSFERNDCSAWRPMQMINSVAAHNHTPFSWHRRCHSYVSILWCVSSTLHTTLHNNFTHVRLQYVLHTVYSLPVTSSFACFLQLISAADASEQQGLVHGGHIPKLWPFYRHTLSAVRSSVLQTLLLLLRAKSASGWLPGALESMMRLTFQNMLLEESAEIRQLTSDLCVFVL